MREDDRFEEKSNAAESGVYGEPAPAAAATPSGGAGSSKKMMILILSVVAVLLAGAIVAVVLIRPAMKRGRSSQRPAETRATAPQTLTAETQTQTAETRTDDKDSRMSADTPPTAPPLTAPQTESPATAQQTTAQQTYAPQTQQQTTVPVGSGVYLYAGESYMIGFGTPSHAGLVLRGGPGTSYEKRAVAPEGTILLCTGAGSGEYVPVEYYMNDVHYSGWVLYRYLTEDHSGGDIYNYSGNSGTGTSYARIGDTPDHAGLVLRADATYYSEKLGVLPEGTTLTLLGQTKGDYTQVQTPDGTVGWVMYVYLES